MPSFDMKKYQEKIIARAIKDRSFCNELKKNPKAVLERELGITCPSNLTIEVIELPTNKWIILIPTVSNADKLSETELVQVAGGVQTGPTGSRGIYC